MISGGGGRLDDLLDGGMPSLVTAAHELKAPLALIRQLSLLLDDDSLTRNEQQRMLDQVRLTSEKALRLTSDLTKSARLDDAMFALEPINPQQLCEDIVHELSPLFVAHDRQIRLAERRNQILLIANRDLLRRVIINFSDNALHYCDPRSPVEIQLGLRDFGKTVRLGVRDFGPALPATNQLLQPGGGLGASRPLSSGLGLHITRQFADAMSGRIGVTRHRNGSTFYIDLPSSRQLSLI